MYVYLFKKYQVFIISLIVILLNGCSSTNMKDFENKTPKLNLFEFFKGETVAYGIFEDRFGKLRRQFRVKIKGVLKKTLLHLMKNLFTTMGKKQQGFGKLKKLMKIIT